MESKIILYHSNIESECARFIKDNGYLIASRNEKDDIWLGSGMYFWDNKGNVHWWNKKQQKRNNGKKYDVVCANVKLDRLLDLTDFEVYTMMEKLWKKVCEKIGKDTNKSLGEKLNFLLDEKGLNGIYSVIKVYGKYNNTPSNGLFKFDPITIKAEPTMAVKCIYNVKDAGCIMEKEYLSEEENDDG